MKKTVFLTILSLMLAMSVTSYAFHPSGNPGRGHRQDAPAVVPTVPSEAGATPAAITFQAQHRAFMEMKRQQKDQARAEMTDHEKRTYEDAAAAMRVTSPSAIVLDVGAVKLGNHTLRFDTPPVIRGGRTLVPVRALTEGLGATVKYTTEGGIGLVTISKTTTTTAIGLDGVTTTSTSAITVVLTIGSTTVSITENGVTRTVDLADTKPGVACGRTYVPLRFLAEVFGLKVSHDGATGTIDIDEDDDAVPVPSTTEGAITVPSTTEGAITATGDATDAASGQ